MLWFRAHRRFQERLSAYIDAELPEKDVIALDAHVKSCDACAGELEELRLASAVLQELPDLEAPRSFRLSPADVVRPAAAPAVHSLSSGLRFTGAGLAAALAILLVLDTGGIVGGGDEGTRDSGGAFTAGDGEVTESKAMGPGESMSLDAAAESGSADAFFATEPPEGGGMSPENPAVASGTGDGTGNVDGADGVAVPGSGEATGTPLGAGVYSGPPVVESPGLSTEPLPATGGETDGTLAPLDERAAGAVSDATPTPTATPAPGAASADNAVGLGLNGFEEQDTETLTALDADVDSDDGPSALLVTEIVLAALLGASVVGVAAATYAERRRR